MRKGNESHIIKTHLTSNRGLITFLIRILLDRMDCDNLMQSLSKLRNVMSVTSVKSPLSCRITIIHDIKDFGTLLPNLSNFLNCDIFREFQGTFYGNCWITLDIDVHDIRS